MLYFVATPIGNLKDITLRALEVLKSVDAIYCEDTRHSLALFNHYDIKKPLFSYHKFNEQKKCEEIIDRLSNGQSVAVVSDAGMPCISDPGNVLINKLIENGLDYTIIPGASASLCALVLSGFDSSKFAFVGFLPEKQSERQALLEKYKQLDMTLIFYSAPHDVNKDLQSIYSVFGNRRVATVKEITKIYEKVDIFNLKDMEEVSAKGEYVIIVEKSTASPNEGLTDKELIDKYVSEGLDKKEALKKVAKERKIPKSELYKLTIND